MGKLKSTNRFRFICYPFLFVVNSVSLVTRSHEDATQKGPRLTPQYPRNLFIIAKVSSKRMLKLLTKDPAKKEDGTLLRPGHFEPPKYSIAVKKIQSLPRLQLRLFPSKLE